MQMKDRKIIAISGRKSWVAGAVVMAVTVFGFPGLQNTVGIFGAVPAMAQTAKPHNDDTGPVGVPDGPFYWQLQGVPEPADYISVVDSDLFDTPASLVAKWRQEEKYPICYINVGAVEDWRDDAHQFPAKVIGRPLEGWDGENWLDIRHFDSFAKVITDRLDRCKAKGFEGIEPDNIDGYDNETGFNISRKDQLKYLNWLIEQAHRRGLTIGQKNAPALVPDLVKKMDFALIESAWRDNFMDDFDPYGDAGKAVFAVEYQEDGVDFDAFCASASDHGFEGLLTTTGLDAAPENCP
jgi:endo-alpha-1,4-polygalactosaminidase (GH114 family)